MLYRTPSNFAASTDLRNVKNMEFFMVTFPIYQFSNILSQNIEKKFWGYPPFGPLKIIANEK